ncbi:MAG: hypothetical protein JWN44_1202 [Myxococcales bacterium]|nr:hypothetical protein [Myxococcales bacterium]
MRALFAAAGVAAAIGCGVAARAESLPVEPPPPVPPAEVARAVKLVPVVDGLRRPVALVFAPGDATRRLFIVEQHAGTIRVLQDGKLLPAPFLDLHGRISTGNEQGLLGLAFHPAWAKNGKFYVHYTDARHGDIHVVEFDAQRRERELLFLKHRIFNNHNGGELLFGPDGKLYVGTGDGGWANDPWGHSQDWKERLGKMLRFDVDAPGTPQPELLMRGLRNPWRYAFDRKTGDLYIADVGQDRWEEVDVIPAGTFAGRNLGWKIMEGLHCRSGDACERTGLTLPVVEYNHKAGCSITGGYVYRGKALPMLDGAYFYADFCTSLVRSFRWQGGGGAGGGGGKVVDHWDWRRVLDPESKLSQISTFGEDADGELYIVSLDGAIWRLARATEQPKSPERK